MSGTVPGPFAGGSVGVEALERDLGHRFADPALLEAALTHPSLGRVRDPVRYERLEFLGDRVLGLVVAELLLERFPREDEGALTERLHALVRRETLVMVGERLGLDRHLRMAESGRVDGRRGRETAMADACEAVIAAVYLDGGLGAARTAIRRYWTEAMTAEIRPPREPKMALQEWLQGRGRALPKYAVIDREGPAHRPCFTVEVSIDDGTVTRAEGGSKRAAEQAAAAAMLAKLQSDG